MAKFEVMRRHAGDKDYFEGDVREGKASDFKQLVDSGILRPMDDDEKSAPAPSNKMQPDPSNKEDEDADSLSDEDNGDDDDDAAPRATPKKKGK